MKTPEIDHRTKQDIFEKIRETSASYVPEWQCDPLDPDAGTVLASVYSEMYEDTLDHLHQVLTRHRISFASELGTDLRPASSASGIVTFGLSTDDFGGVFVPAGYQVFGDSDDEGKPLEYHTDDSLYVTPAKPVEMVCLDAVHDRILSWKREDHPASFTLFDPENENLQKHFFTLSVPDLGCVQGEADLLIAFEPYRFAADQAEPAWLAEEALFTYTSEQGQVAFERQTWEKGHLVLHKGQDQPAFCNSDPDSGIDAVISCTYTDPYLHQPLQVSGVSLTARNSACRPDLIQTGEGPQPADRFYPFGQEPALYSECYLASAEALSKKGAEVSLSFILGFEEHPFKLVEEETIKEWKLFMKNSDFIPPKEYDVSIQQAVWEYYNGRGWSRLFADASWEDIFTGEEGRLNQRVVITFRCPEDAAPIELFSQKSRFIRVRITRMANLYKVRGRYFTPVIQDPVFAYSYPDQAQPAGSIRAENNLSRTDYKIPAAEQNSCMTLLQGLTGKKNAIYLCFDHPFEGGPIRMYAQLEGKSAKSMPPLVCSCYTPEGFREVRLLDKTGYFSSSGMISLFSSTDAVRGELFSCSGYWYRLEDSRGGYTELMSTGSLPVIRNLYMNSVSVHSAEDRGSSANQPADTITTLGKSIGFLSTVTNPKATAGGLDPEDRESALERCAAELRHHGRALTASDFEALVMEAVRDIRQVRCFCGRDAEGSLQNGHVTIVLVHEDFESVKERVLSWLKPRTAPGLIARSALHITEPNYVSINCRIELTVDSYDRIYQVHHEVEEKLNQFLDPVSGNTNGQGWKIGSLPSEMQIYHLLQGTEGISYLNSVRITGPSGDIRRLSDPYILPVSGTHSIVIGVKYAGEHQS